MRTRTRTQEFDKDCDKGRGRDGGLWNNAGSDNTRLVYVKTRVLLHSKEMGSCRHFDGKRLGLRRHLVKDDLNLDSWEDAGGGTWHPQLIHGNEEDISFEKD